MQASRRLLVRRDQCERFKIECGVLGLHLAAQFALAALSVSQSSQIAKNQKQLSCSEYVPTCHV